MAVRRTSLGMALPDGRELVTDTDERISENAQIATSELVKLNEAVARLNTALLAGTPEAETLVADVMAAVEAAARVGDDTVVELLTDPGTGAGAIIAGKADLGHTHPVDPVLQAAVDGKLSASGVLDHSRRTPFQGLLSKWGAALKGQATRAAVYVNTGSSTANGGNVTSQTKNWLQRLNSTLTDRTTIRLEDVTTTVARPANGVQIYSRAVGGTHSGNYLTDTDVTKIGRLLPDLVTHMVGSNDYAAGTAVATYKANMQSWVNKIRTVSPDTVQVLIHQNPRYDITPVAGKTWTDYGKALEEVAQANPDVCVFFNLAEAFEVMGTTPRWGVTDPDNIHMQDHGNRMLADMIGEFLGTPKIGYLPQETYSTRTFTGGSITAAGTVFATISIPPRPYPRELVLHGSVFAGTDTGSPGDYVLDVSDATVLDSASTGSLFVRCSGIGTANRQTYSGTLHLPILPNKAVTARITYSPNGGTLYMSPTSTYNSFTAVLAPA